MAARGIDLPDVTFVLQYDTPSDAKDYVHRIGRTARLGRAGSALSLLLPSESGYIAHLRKKGVVVKPEDGMKLLHSLVDIPVSSHDAEAAAAAVKKGKKKKVEDWAMDLQMMFERFVMADSKVPFH